MAYKGSLPVSDKPYFCVTGHRPDKLEVGVLSGYDARVQSVLVSFAIQQLTRVVQRAPRAGVITGMALGWDMAVAEAACVIGLPFVAAVPFEGQEVRWPDESRRRYHRLLARSCSLIEVCSPGFSNAKMHSRNSWMVDNSTGVLALWDGSSGGTGHCVKYAQGKSVPVLNVWRSWVSYQSA